MCFGRQQPIQNQKQNQNQKVIKNLKMMVWHHSAAQMCFGHQQGERGYKKFIGVILLLTEFDCSLYSPRDRKRIPLEAGPSEYRTDDNPIPLLLNPAWASRLNKNIPQVTHINNKNVTSITHKCFSSVKSWLICWFLITIVSENEH